MTLFELDFAGVVALDIGASPVRKCSSDDAGRRSAWLDDGGQEVDLFHRALGALARASTREREGPTAKPWEGEGLARTVLERPSPGRRRCAPSATLSRVEAR